MVIICRPRWAAEAVKVDTSATSYEPIRAILRLNPRYAGRYVQARLFCSGNGPFGAGDIIHEFLLLESGGQKEEIRERIKSSNPQKSVLRIFFFAEVGFG
jgi:hypothetical protein